MSFFGNSLGDKTVHRLLPECVKNLSCFNALCHIQPLEQLSLSIPNYSAAVFAVFYSAISVYLMVLKR